MHLPVFENAYFLQSIGWAIANNLWQAGALWLLFQTITTLDKNLSPLIKYHLGITLMGASFIWFLFTALQNFLALTNSVNYSGNLMAENWIMKFEYINPALPYLSCIYLTVLCLYSVHFIKKLSANRILQKAGLTKAPVDYRLFVTQTAIHLGIKKKIQVWISSNVDVPSITGFIKPVILLPAAIINHLSVKQVEAILLHELAHIRRDDYIANLAQSIIEIVLFFNPFVFLLSNVVRKERENCCDDWVMNYRYDQQDYARALLVLEEQRQFNLGFALAATNDKKNLLNRVKRLFRSAPQTGFTRWQQIKLTCLCLSILIAIFAMLPSMANKPVKVSDFQNPLVNAEAVSDNEANAKATERRIFANEPVTRPVEKTKPPKSTSRRKQNKNVVETHYMNAFINEELLTDNVNQAIPSPASKKEITGIKLLIKIEEQQSGKEQTNTYLFELKNDNGKPSVRPLIILNKLKFSGKSKSAKTVIDSIAKPTIRKRITS